MTEPKACGAARCLSLSAYCDNCDVLVGLVGLHVVEVDQGADRLTVTVESERHLMGCHECGVVAVGIQAKLHRWSNGDATARFDYCSTSWWTPLS